MKKTAILVITMMAAAAGLAAAEPAAVLIKNATVYTVTGPPIQGGDVLVVGGKIKAVGKGLEAPAGADVLDATGLAVYPGFIDSFSHFGLAEIGAVRSTVDYAEMGKENPELKAAWAINPASVHFRTSRITGTTAALVAPVGGTFPGMAALVKMDGWTFPEMQVKEVAASLINFPMTPRPPREGAAAQQEAKSDVTSKLVEKIRDYLKEARRYLELKALAAKDPKVTPPAANPKYEALAPVFEGKLPVIISVEKAKDIELAIKFAKDEKLKAVFRGCLQGYQVADKIKQAGIPVIIDSLYTSPSEPEDGYDAPYRNVGAMAKAGVTICFSSGDDPGIGKDLPYYAAKAVAFGLDHEEAVKALTINPAKIFGVDDLLGSLEPGKDADFFLTTGDPLDMKSEVKVLFINGRKIDLANWWEELYQRWKGRPIK